ncbi:MAG: ankyrin repeat domain-containing protein [Spirochaetes bacterium]|nr:ankyrin repeat domain-containing protein [Spirochaetota bacterium]
MIKNLLGIVICAFSLSIFAQENNAICIAIDNEDFKAFSRAVNRTNVNGYNDKGETPLTHLLQKKEYYRTINKYLVVLFKHGADPNLPNKNGTPPLHLAGYDHEICSYLLKKGADINIRDSHGQTMLYDLLVYTEVYGGWSKFFNDIDFFIKNGGNINSVDNYGISVLLSMLSRVMSYPASKKGGGGYLSHDFSQGIEYLAKKGANVNIVTKSGETALTISRKTNANQDQIDTLIKLGAVK